MRSILAFALCLALSGCPSSPGSDAGGYPDGPTTFPDCDAIVEACHEVDPGTGPIHDCHETAHDAASNEPCAPIRATCVMMCEAVDGGVIAEDAPHDHDEDAPHDHDAGM